MVLHQSNVNETLNMLNTDEFNRTFGQTEIKLIFNIIDQNTGKIIPYDKDLQKYIKIRAFDRKTNYQTNNVNLSKEFELNDCNDNYLDKYQVLRDGYSAYINHTICFKSFDLSQIYINK